MAEPADTHLERLAGAFTMAADRATVEMVGALRDHGVDPILLKGPALAQLLYADGSRTYVDSDLLVPPEGLERTEALLRRSGFVQQPVEQEPDLGLPHARRWSRPEDGAEVDLHALIAGVGVAPGELWRSLEPLTETLAVGGVDCRVLVPHALLVMVALHAAQHGPDVQKPLEDLRRAVELGSEAEWRRAAALADELDATVNFSSALRYLPEGVRLAERLGLPSAELLDAAREAGSRTRLALGFHRLAGAENWRQRAAQLRREVAPSPAHMRWWSGLARRGPAGLAAAYVWRFAQLVWHTPPGLMAWRRARGGR